ncbi:hypothetical protein FOZ63_010497, partial [Perkinsus olseni]
VSAKTTVDIPSTRPRLLDYAFARLPDDILDRLTALPLTDGLKHVDNTALQCLLVDTYHSTYHEGVQATFSRLKKLYSWPKMLDTISVAFNYITCTVGIIPTVVRSDNGSIFGKVAPTGCFTAV